MCSEGDMALDGGEKMVYFRLDKEYARKYPIAEQIAPNFGPRKMGAIRQRRAAPSVTNGQTEYWLHFNTFS